MRMDQLTHTVRRSNQITIIQQCPDRPAGTTAKQWLAENGISEKSYYYCLRKIRREVCEQEGLPEATSPSEISFVEIPVKTALDTVPGANCPCRNGSGCCNQIRQTESGISKRCLGANALQAHVLTFTDFYGWEMVFFSSISGWRQIPCPSQEPVKRPQTLRRNSFGIL